MNQERRTRRRGIIWLITLLLFVVLLVVANEMTEGERFYGVAPIVVIGLAVTGLLQVYRATAEDRAWEMNTRRIAMLSLGTALYAIVAYTFNELLKFSVGPVALQPQISIPVLFGYAFGPIVGFFTGAVGSLLGDFVAGFGVFPAWHIGTGLTGLVPGLLADSIGGKRHLSSVSNVVVVTIAIVAGLIFVHPRAPQPWTGEVMNYSFWGWALIIGGLVMLGHSALLREVSVVLAALSLHGALGILVGNAFAALAHLWMNEFGLATAIIGEFAPAAGTDILNLVVFTPLVLAAYRGVRRYLRD